MALGITGRTAFSLPKLLFPGDSGPFDMLVVGDSLVWGQGLEEKDKFYTLTKKWLETEVFAGNRPVNLKVKANSGATIYLHEFEAGALKMAEETEVKDYHPEVNIGLPTMTKQAELALEEYEKEGKTPGEVDLVMLTGGITDITVAEVLSSDKSDEQLKEDIVKYCNEAMYVFLENSARTFPNALFAVIGYYPLLSDQASTKKVMNTFLELYKFPRAFKFLINNIIGKQFFKGARDKAIRRSRIWTENSGRELRKAVERVNARFGRRRAVFIESPITEENSFATKEPLVWNMGKNGRSEDPFYDVRHRECKEEIRELEESTDIKYPIRFCELAGLGHPNPQGAKAYAEAIEAALKPLIMAKTAKVS